MNQPEQKPQVKIRLTEEQKKQLQQETGVEANAIEFTVEELEARIAPIAIFNF
jgi:hypothetical protein